MTENSINFNFQIKQFPRSLYEALLDKRLKQSEKGKEHRYLLTNIPKRLVLEYRCRLVFVFS